MNKKLEYHEFLTNYVNNSENFIFMFRTIKIEFTHDGELYIVKFSDNLKNEKILKLESPKLVNYIQFNNIPMIEFWDKFELINRY